MKNTNNSLPLFVFPSALNLTSLRECLLSSETTNGSLLKTSSASWLATPCFLKFLSILPLSHSNEIGSGNIFITNQVYYQYIHLSSINLTNDQEFARLFV